METKTACFESMVVMCLAVRKDAAIFTLPSLKAKIGEKI